MWAPRFLFGLGLILSGLLLSISSSGPLGMWVGLEVNMLGLVPLLATHSREYTNFSGVVYFCYQVLGGVLFLMGGLALGYLLFVGLMLKSGMAPVHGWVPVVMGGSSWSLNLIMMTLQKISPFLLLSVLIPSGSALSFEGSLMLVWLVLSLTSLVGALGGLMVTDLKTVLAYSSIMNNGWLLLLSARGLSSNLLIFMSVYFTVLLLLIMTLWGSDWDLPNAWFPGEVWISLFSLAGLPPLVGFIPKFTALMTEASVLVVPLLLSSVIACYYYLMNAMTFALSNPRYKQMVSVKDPWTISASFSFNLVGAPALASIMLWMM